jgi:hypothetical protein
MIWIAGVVGMTGINGQALQVTAVGATSITVNYDSSVAPVWVSGGTVVWYGGAFNYATGVYTVTFYNAFTGTNAIANGTWYPKLPVMGLTQEITTAINQDLLIAFDQNKAYRFDNNLQDFRDITFDTNIATQAGTFNWNSTNSAFFWAVNYANAVFATNFVTGDPIRYLAVSAVAGTPEVWRPFQPVVNAAAKKLLTARMLVPYRGRLVAINTIEDTGNYPQRARWSQNGTPYYNTGAGVDTPPAPFSADAAAWKDDILGKGGYIDAPTREDARSWRISHQG